MSCRLICLAVLGASLAAGGKAKALEPIQNWVLDYREDQCLASRDYGSAADPVTLGIRPAPNGQTYELMAARRGSGPEFATEKKGSVDFGNGPINAWLLNYGGALTKADVMQFRISALEMRQALTAKTVTLRESGRPQLSFTLAAMPALLKGMQECTADLQQHWNMGEREKVIATRRAAICEGCSIPAIIPPKRCSDTKKEASASSCWSMKRVGSAAAMCCSPAGFRCSMPWGAKSCGNVRPSRLLATPPARPCGPP
jgi:hypothetical protein